MYTWHPKICDLAYANKSNKLHSFFPPFFIFLEKSRTEEDEEMRDVTSKEVKRENVRSIRHSLSNLSKFKKNKTLSHKWKQRLRDQGR